MKKLGGSFSLLLVTKLNILSVLISLRSNALPTRCDDLYRTSERKPCAGKQGLSNLITFSNAYCFNDGSGICKAFSGQFEYKFDVKNNKWLGKMPKSEFVDERGYHKRVPVNYDINGRINYADQSINWARQWAGVTNKNMKVNFLSINEFNWCAYVKSNYWPYKSAIRKGPYTIYFYNRQSCIFKDGVETKKQHYNTRFLHLSRLRIDIDINPTIFAMEDFKAKGDRIRLVKHKRQHWYEVEFEVIENPSPNITYFVSMKETETLPSTVRDGSGPLLNSEMLQPETDVCISDHFQVRSGGSKNAKLVPAHCGYDAAETLDMTVQEWDLPDRAQPYEIDVHCLPYFPEISQTFFDINIESQEYWENFDAMTAFTAVTSIPVKGQRNKVRVLLFFSLYGKDVPKDKYDEFYPRPYFNDYIASARYSPDRRTIVGWDANPKTNARYVPNLNYVDDIAYLHKCDSVLIIFGPLYTEMLASDFSIDKKTLIDPIYNLGIQEPVNAFFAEPNSNKLWVYHRTNWIVQHTYTCGNPAAGKLVTARRSGKYTTRIGSGRPSVFEREIFDPIKWEPSEEYLFKLMGLFNGSLSPDAPDASLYPLAELPVPPPPKNLKDYTWVYILIGVAILLILLLCIICIFTLRRRIARRKHREKQLASQVSGMGTSTMTTRSGLQSKSQSLSSTKTGRSSLHTGSSRSSIKPKLTERSANYGSPRAAIATRLSAVKVQPGRSVRSKLSTRESSHVSRSPTQRSSTMSANSHKNR